MDNGPELTWRHFLACCIEQKIAMKHIQPGKPMQNGHVESFHGRLRDECLNVHWLRNLFDVRRKITLWRLDYNAARPHSSLAYRTPEEFARLWQRPSSSLVFVTQPERGPCPSLRRFWTKSYSVTSVDSLGMHSRVACNRPGETDVFAAA
jgi:hypothetical protein